MRLWAGFPVPALEMAEFCRFLGEMAEGVAAYKLEKQPVLRDVF